MVTIMSEAAEWSAGPCPNGATVPNLDCAVTITHPSPIAFTDDNFFPSVTQIKQQCKDELAAGNLMHMLCTAAHARCRHTHCTFLSSVRGGGFNFPSPYVVKAHHDSHLSAQRRP